MATQEQNDDVKFFVYAANTVEQFLDDPEKLPAAFAEADFLFGATDGLDMIRLAPDSPARRHAGG